MNFSSFPLVLFLLLPGFLAIYSGFLVSRFRRLSGFQGTAWSLVASLALIVIIYPIFTSLVEPPDSAWPGLLDMLQDPVLIPGWLLAALYLVGPSLGIIIGVADRNGLFESLLRRLGIDLRLHGDLWGRMMREAGYLRVYLNDGSLLYGWPEYYSVDRSVPGPELYLTQVIIWDPDGGDWVAAEETTSVLLHGNQISRIEMLGLPAEESEDKSRSS